MTCVDRPLSEYLRTVDATHPDYINIFRAYTDIAKGKWYLIISALGIIACALAVRMPRLSTDAQLRAQKWGEGFLFFFAAVAASGIATNILKNLIGRARPVMLQNENVFGFSPLSFQATFQSMPSGHTTTAFAVATVLAWFFPKAQTLWLLFAAAIAVSRIMVNAHYLADVFAGAAVGFATVLFLRHHINHNGINHIRRVIFPIDRKA